MIFLPFATLVLLSLAQATKRGLAEGFVRAFIILLTFIALSTEFLSFFNLIEFYPVCLTWLLFFLGCCIQVKKSQLEIPQIKIPKVKISKVKISRLSVLDFCIPPALLITFTQGILYSPNTYDSMTYHLARVAHWIEQGNVSFYYTAIGRQNYFAPLAEFAMLHLQVLSGFDHYAFLVQWTAYVVIICSAQLLAKQLKLGAEQQKVSSLVAATTPVCIFLAASTKNDLLVAAFIAAFTIFLFRTVFSAKIGNALFASLSLALAILTKGIAYLHCFAIICVFSIYYLYKTKWDLKPRWHLVRILLAMAGVVILFNAPHLWRNYAAYGDPLSPVNSVYLNESFALKCAPINLAKTIASNLASSSEAFNRLLQALLEAAFGKELNSSDCSWPRMKYRVEFRLREGLVGNLFHLLLLGYALFVAYPREKRKSQKRKNLGPIFWYTSAILFTFFLHCFLLKWEAFAPRLLPTFFVLSSPLLARALFTFSRQLRLAILAVVYSYAILIATTHHNRPLIPAAWAHSSRAEQYFRLNKGLFKHYKYAIDTLIRRKAKGNIGLYMGLDQFEYPFWALSRIQSPTTPALRFVHLRSDPPMLNENIYPELPDFMIATKEISDPTLASVYERIPSYGRAQIYVLKSVEFRNPESN